MALASRNKPQPAGHSHPQPAGHSQPANKPQPAGHSHPQPASQPQPAGVASRPQPAGHSHPQPAGHSQSATLVRGGGSLSPEVGAKLCEESILALYITFRYLQCNVTSSTVAIFLQMDSCFYYIGHYPPVTDMLGSNMSSKYSSSRELK